MPALPAARSHSETLLRGASVRSRSGVLKVDADGGLSARLATGRGHTLARDSEVQQIIASAGFVGRWFAKLDQPATVFVVLGVAP